MLMLQNLAHVAGGEGNIVVVLLLLKFLLLLVFIHHYFLYCRISPPKEKERERWEGSPIAPILPNKVA